MVISPYHTIIGGIYDLTCNIKHMLFYHVYMYIGGGGEYYFIVVYFRGIDILKMKMGLFDKLG